MAEDRRKDKLGAGLSKRKCPNSKPAEEGQAPSDYPAPDTPLLLQLQYIWGLYNRNRIREM